MRTKAQKRAEEVADRLFPVPRISPQMLKILGKTEDEWKVLCRSTSPIVANTMAEALREAGTLFGLIGVKL